MKLTLQLCAVLLLLTANKLIAQQIRLSGTPFIGIAGSQNTFVGQCRLVKGRIALGVASFAYLSRKHGASFKPVHFAGLSV